MITIDLLLIIAFLVCEALAAIGVAAGRVNLVALGLAFYALSLLI